MSNILFMTLHLLLALTVSAVPFRISQAVSSCYDGQQSHVVGIKRLAYGSPVTLPYEDDQRVTISSDSAGKALAAGNVTLETSSGGVLTVQGAATAPDISASLVEGENTMTLMGDEGAVIWLITHSPCPVQKPEARTLKPEQAVIAPTLPNESAPAVIKPAPVPSNEPASVVTPAPVPAEDGAAMQRVLVFILTLAIGLMKLMHIAWMVGAVLLAVAGLVFAFRKRHTIADWITEQFRTIRKEGWHS